MLSEKLRKACLKHDQKAHFELYKVLFSFMMSTARRYTSQEADAEDLFHRAYLKILDNLERIPANIAFEAWCRRILINMSIDDFRKKQIEQSWLSFTNEVPDETLILEEAPNLDMETLKNMLKQLPPATEKVFNLFAIDGFSHAEIGSMLGISEGTSKWHLSNARSLLKNMIQQSSIKKYAI